MTASALGSVTCSLALLWPLGCPLGRRNNPHRRPSRFRSSPSPAGPGRETGGVDLLRRPSPFRRTDPSSACGSAGRGVGRREDAGPSRGDRAVHQRGGTGSGIGTAGGHGHDRVARRRCSPHRSPGCELLRTGRSERPQPWHDRRLHREQGGAPGTESSRDGSSAHVIALVQHPSPGHAGLHAAAARPVARPRLESRRSSTPTAGRRCGRA